MKSSEVTMDQACMTGDANSKQDESISRFSSPLVGLVNWDYRQQNDHIHSLYELAKEKTWNAARDIDWSPFSRASNFPTIEEFNPFRGFKQYDELPTDEKIRISWWRHALEVSEILHGEQGAMLTAAQLVTCMPTIEGKMFASSQAFDEARHVEFFSRYLQEVVGAVHEPSTELRSLITTTLSSSDWDMKFIACQILIESLAMAKFQEMRRSVRVPMLEFAISYIAKDEARHVNFGVEILKERIASLSESEKEARSEFVLDSLLQLANSLNISTRIGHELDWDAPSLRLHLRKYRLENRETTRDRFRQVIMNLGAVGLLTEKTRGRINELRLDI